MFTEPNEDFREACIRYLEEHYVGPIGGPNERTINRPDRTYLAGTLYPRDIDELGSLSRSDDGPQNPELLDEVDDEPEEDAAQGETSWRPSTAGLSFFHTAGTFDCTVEAATYQQSEGTREWVRSPLEPAVVAIDSSQSLLGDQAIPLFDGLAHLSHKSRPLGNGWLTTVSVSNAREASSDDLASHPEWCLYQLHFSCRLTDGEILPYPSTDAISPDLEEQELALRFRNRRAYAMGHGTGAHWEIGDVIKEVSTSNLPVVKVHGTRALTNTEATFLDLAWLADERIPKQELANELEQLVVGYETWVDAEAKTAAGLADRHTAAATSLLKKMRGAIKRMREGVALLREDSIARRSFALANRAMLEQMRHSNHLQAVANGMRQPNDELDESIRPRWRPFQLAFILHTLASTASIGHEDRETVDLIWFPTGGGKTEAYLGLAAFEAIRRRLTSGDQGGGTAIITRYTLRLLTAQQFQRAATLICALERLRASELQLKNLPAFSIGLWVGEGSTPNSFRDASDTADRIRSELHPENPFQLESCPWCGTTIVPPVRTADESRYGFRAGTGWFELFCPNNECDFNPRLPIQVVDDGIYENPPTLLLATVDKFAQVAWLEKPGRLFGRGGVPFDPPSLIIQDELHLLSGPLGTTVSLYESAIETVIAWGDKPPKVIASTATIRAAGAQVRGLFASDVALFPPSGLDESDSYFASTDITSAGRLYVGLMPQAHTPSYATVRAIGEILAMPIALEAEGAALDAYWTVVAYHHSLRELGRTITIVRDDVQSFLAAQGDGSRARRLASDGVEELTSRVEPAGLNHMLKRLASPVSSGDAIDVVATTNMLSVGIDVARLGVMLMNGQPKTTAEYIQATSRVGRGKVPGLVVSLLRGSKPRDRSHFEDFQGFHDSVYRHVEPTSITPWSAQSRRRSLAAAVVIIVRHGVGLSANSDAGLFNRDSPFVQKAVEMLMSRVRISDREEEQAVRNAIHELLAEWQERQERGSSLGDGLVYSGKKGSSLLKEMLAPGEGWPAAHSMRSVDRAVRVLVGGL